MPRNSRRTTLGPVNVNRRQSVGGETPSKAPPTNKSRPPRGRQSMLPRVGRDNPPLPPSNSSPARSVSSTKTQSSRRRSVGGRQSLASIKQDPRPINDRTFQQKSANRLLDYLVKNGYNYPVSLKTLARPTQKDFGNICTFLLRQLDPSFQQSAAVKFEDEVAMNFKAMGYPSNISKTSLVAAGSPHTWPTLMAALTWLVERLEILLLDEVENQETMAQGIQGNESLKDLAIRHERAFYDFLGNSYNAYLQNDRALEDQTAQDYVEFAEEANNQVERQIERVSDLNSVLLEKIHQLNEHSLSLPALQQKREDYANELEQYYDMVRQMEEHRDALENRVSERTKELQETNTRVEQLTEKIDVLAIQIQNQELSVEDVRKMEEESERVNAALEQAVAIREKKKDDVWEATAKVNLLFEELSSVAQEYSTVLDHMSLVIPEVKAYKLDIQRENAGATKQSEFIGVDIRDEVMPFLVRCKDDCVDRVASLRQSLKEALDHLELSKTAFTEATDKLDILGDKKMKLEEQMETEQEQNEAALGVRLRENEDLEQKIASLRDPVALEEQLASYQRQCSQLEAMQLKQQEENQTRKRLVREEIDQAFKAVTEHNARVERLLEEANRYKAQKQASLGKITTPSLLS